MKWNLMHKGKKKKDWTKIKKKEEKEEGKKRNIEMEN